ncbi:hypothetical protein FRC07_007084 [Ceratobasidium sp. 392]|nr:hypothetical protein FRC07_007084 [Ceratobasidium sp. 392]
MLGGSTAVLSEPGQPMTTHLSSPTKLAAPATPGTGSVQGCLVRPGTSGLYNRDHSTSGSVTHPKAAPRFIPLSFMSHTQSAADQPLELIAKDSQVPVPNASSPPSAAPNPKSKGKNQTLQPGGEPTIHPDHQALFYAEKGGHHYRLWEYVRMGKWVYSNKDGHQWWLESARPQERRIVIVHLLWCAFQSLKITNY